MRRSQVTAALAGLAILTVGPLVRAEPQASVGLTLGAAGEGYDRQYWKRTAFHFGLRGDVIFGRKANRDFGVGPYAEVLTHAFDGIQFGGGVSTLLPVIDSFPMTLSAGAYGRKGSDPYPLEPGFSAALFWGSRSYNFHSNYVLSGGLLTQFRYGLGASRESSILIAAQVDVLLLAMPFIFLASAVRGGSGEAKPVAPAK